MLPVLPVILYVPAIFCRSFTLLSPKSPTFRWPSSFRRRLAGLRSLWMMTGEQLWRKHSALASSTLHCSTIFGGGIHGRPPRSLRLFSRKSSRFPADMYSLRMMRGSPMVHAPRNMTRLGCLSRERTEISLMRSAFATAWWILSFSSVFVLSILATTSSPRHVEQWITPPSPSPSRSFSTISERSSSHCSARERTWRGWRW
mmetsp:Transcript_67780/g.167459  ORF Transcript_67780/g.167459 Transcript_67780/m.167459 type:complete len:201 (+) Transcript_67780:922-1524(+)